MTREEALDKTKRITCPSGQVVVLRRPTALDLYRINSSLPDMGAEPGVARKPMRDAADKILSAIRGVVILSEEPRYWADFRPEAEQDAKPMEPPPGRTLYDLSLDDTLALDRELGAMLREEQERCRPLSETAAPS